MRRAASLVLVAGIACLVASPLVFWAFGTVFGTGLSRCPSGGPCTDEIVWTPYLAAFGTAILGTVCAVAAWRLNHRASTPETAS